jgi:hypothetical protein
MHYSGYSKFNIEPYSNYDFDGLTIENNSSDEYHIFLKKLENIDIKFEKKISIEDFQDALENNQIPTIKVSKTEWHTPHCCCLTCLEGYY